MQDIIKQITKAGYKITAPRLAVINYLNKKAQPVTVKDILVNLKKADQASVYRTLKLLEDLKIVKSEILNREKLYCLGNEDHHHVICLKCNYIESIPCQHHFDNIKNFTQINHQLTLTGVCKKCSLKK